MESLLLLTIQGRRTKESVFHNAGEIFAFNKAPRMSLEETANRDKKNQNDGNDQSRSSDDNKNPYDFIDNIHNGKIDEAHIFYENSEIIRPIQSPLTDFSILESKQNYRQLISVITTNSSWSTAILSDSIFSEKNIQEKIKDISNIFRSLNIFSKYLDNYYTEISGKFKLSNDIILSLRQNSLNKSWESYYDNLKNIKLFNDNREDLSSLLLTNELKEHAVKSKSANEELKQKTDKLEKDLHNAANKKTIMEKKIELFKQNSIIKNFNNLNLNDILVRIKTLTKAVQNETKDVMEYMPEYQDLNSNSSLSPEQLEKLIKTISRHQQEYVPEILQLANDLYYLQLNLNVLFKKLRDTLVEVMNKTSLIQSSLAEIRGELKTIAKQIDTLQLTESSICIVIDLPLLYGLFLLENVRRIEWEAELKKFVGKTVENFALINDKEIKLRHKWEANYGIILKLLKLDDVFTLHNLLTVDFTTNKNHAIKELTLNVTRDDVRKYISSLKNNNVSGEFVNLLQTSLEELDNQKVSLYSKFDSYLNFNISKDANSTDNELIKSYQTRIKKLESILHQHKYKNLNQWPLTFPQINGRESNSRSRSPPMFGHNNSHSPSRNQQEFNNPQKLNLTPQRSLSTTSINKISTVTTAEKVKPIPKLYNRKSSFGKMLNFKPKRESLMFNNKGNIELTNSMILLTEDEGKNRVLVSPQLANETVVEADELNTELIKVSLSEWHDIKNKNNALIVENGKLVAQNDKKDEEIRFLKEHINKLIVDSNTKAQKLQHLDAQEDLINRLNNENAELNQELNHTVNDCKNAKLELSGKRHELTTKNEELTLVKQNLHEALDNIDQNKEEIDTLQADLLSNQKELSEVYRKFDKSEGRLKKLTNQYQKSQDALDSLTLENHQLKTDVDNLKKELKAANLAQDDNSVTLEQKVAELNKAVDQKQAEIGRLTNELKDLRQNYADISSMKNDLLANMQSKESEFANERNSNSEELARLKAKVEELEDSEDALETINKELANKNSNFINTILQLLDINYNFKKKMSELSTFMLTNFKLICACFEAIGLLITKNDLIPESILNLNNISKLGESFVNVNTGQDDKGIRIVRVRGLRSKNKPKDDLGIEKPVSPLLTDVENVANWIDDDNDDKQDIHELSNSHHDIETRSTDESQTASSIVDIEKIERQAQNVIELFNNNANFEKRYFNFISAAVIDYNLIYISISKRFGDIEHLAKKLQKETKINKEEISRLVLDCQGKISVKNFKPGDLVLFLPTRDGNISDSQNSQLLNQPWAAFNIGSPHYFLKETNKSVFLNKDWMVARVLSITEHTITSKNYSSQEENPFSLSQGVTWYLVEAQEEVSTNNY